MYTILHISDLHRMEINTTSNAELLSSLISDFDRAAREPHPIARPDAIVVSGDLVEGLKIGSEHYPSSLREQYANAEELLARLTDEFLAGDRRRIVIVPGNHDVDWNIAKDSFVEVHQPEASPRSFIEEPLTGYRWSWNELKTFKIADHEIYKQRFNLFSEMYARFYDNVPLTHTVSAENPWNLFILDEGNIAVAAFNSCMANDCYSDVGLINPPDIAECHLHMRRYCKPESLKIAVWHHGVGGPPWASDYLSPSTAKLMVDKGFRLALHGHRHDSTISPLDLYVSVKDTMAIIGAGSLCAGVQALPHGVNQRYNIIQLCQESNSGAVHVREMNQPGIWGPGQLYETGGDSHLSFSWTRNLVESTVQGRMGGVDTVIVDEIEQLISSGRSEEAVQVLENTDTIPDTYKRLLLAKAFRESQQWAALKELLNPPQNTQEFMDYFVAAERSGDLSGVEELLDSFQSENKIDLSVLRDLRLRLSARTELGG